MDWKKKSNYNEIMCEIWDEKHFLSEKIINKDNIIIIDGNWIRERGKKREHSINQGR